MRFIYTAIICILFSVHTVSAQHHGHKRNEVGISTGALYSFEDEGWGVGAHLHYFRTLGDHSRWAIGGFVEQAWFDDNHFSVGLGAKYEVIEKLQLGVFPGLIFAKHGHNEHLEHTGIANNEKHNTRFSVHTELVYDLFEWDNFHIGPVVDYSWSNDDSHIMLGVHAAICF